MTSNTEDRAGYIAGLRQLADLLDANSDVPLPYVGSRPDAGLLSWILVGSPMENKPRVDALARALPDARWGRPAWSDEVTTLTAAIAGLYVQVIADPREHEMAVSL